MYLLGFDIGSSSIKVALVDAQTRQVLGVVHHPDPAMPIQAPEPGWAEQHPEMWWEHCGHAVRKLREVTGILPTDIAAIGISYQMHGLVLTDREGHVLRPAIIWCDSRAVSFGNQAFSHLGPDFCLRRYLNSPGNFTAAKLAWVKANEPDNYHRIARFMLPGDYIAYRMTGEITTTVPGLSEGIFWDFADDGIAWRLMDHFGFDPDFVPRIVPVFSEQGELTKAAARQLGLRAGIPVTYRAGDQPNNALSLDVLRPGEVAATGGTSGVVYGIVNSLASDPKNRVNSFAHVNHHKDVPRIGVLLCINGAGIEYAWLKKETASNCPHYADMEKLAATVPPGSDGLRLLPFGNGAERMLGNRDPGAHLAGLQFNRHSQAHLLRAGLEGIAFSFFCGTKVLREMGLDLHVIRVGNDNLFQSPIFSETIATLLGCRIEMLRTTGAVGAALASGVGIGVFRSVEESLGGLERVRVFEPHPEAEILQEAYADWETLLGKFI